MAKEIHRPEITEVYSFLRKRNALIVHFSGVPKGSANDNYKVHEFPKDLEHVIKGKAKGLACSVVKPGDTFHGSFRNAMGTIGVILGFKTKASLDAVAPSDCGSAVDEDGNRFIPAMNDIWTEDLRRSLEDRDRHNEWIVKNYDVLGVFVSEPIEVGIESVFEDPEIPECQRDDTPSFNISIIDIKQVRAIFKDQPIYSFSSSAILKYLDAEWVEIDHPAIYIDS